MSSLPQCDFCNGFELLADAQSDRETAERELSEAHTEIDALKDRVRELERRVLDAVRTLEHG